MDNKILEEFEKRFNTIHGNGFHVLSNDGKKSRNCDICLKQKEVNPKGYYRTYLHEQKCYWNNEMFNDVLAFILETLRKQREDIKAEILKRYDTPFGIGKIDPDELLEIICPENTNSECCDAKVVNGRCYNCKENV